jgi:hypothetical protein
MGRSSLNNEDLLARSASQFDVFLTADRNLRHPQNLSTLALAVMGLVAKSNRIVDLRPQIPELSGAIAVPVPRASRQIGS